MHLQYVFSVISISAGAQLAAFMLAAYVWAD
jgi:hypothetical protein